ncbi:MAG: glycoside hydrolase family 57 protein [Staphylothermus sp.]|nr:glycoside hydrolase family 57 protein [Staphylothermus sp.]
MTSIVFMFEVHQPYRLDRHAYNKLLEKALRGSLEPHDLEDAIFDNGLNKLVMERASRKCYIPATRIILENIEKYKNTGKPFKVSFSLSGVFIEQAKMWAPEVIDLFVKLRETEMVEFIEQTYYHSLAAFMPLDDWAELREQIDEHKRIIRETFDYVPKSIENTEFTYNNDIAWLFDKMGYKVVLTEGVDWVLGWRSPNYVYKAYNSEIRVLMRNYRLSDDIGYRFSDRSWDQYPLTADKYASWLAATPGDVIFLAMDYETFGEHHWPETGIYEFLEWLPGEILKYQHLETSTPSEVVDKYPPRDRIDVPSWATISWADERDLSAWLGNNMQRNAFKILTDLRPYVKALDDPEIVRIWKLLTISDHLYYIATKFGSLEQVHSYFSPYKNASEAHAIYVQALSLLAGMISEKIYEKRHIVAKRLILPKDKAFYFMKPTGEYTGYVAHSLSEFKDLLEKIPEDSFLYHLRRKDFQAWLRSIYGLDDVANELDNLSGLSESIGELRKRILKLLKDFYYNT